MNSIKRIFILCVLSLYVISVKSQIIFSPTDYSNLKVWLKSTDGLSVSSGSVSNWIDQSVANINFQQLIPTSQPTFSSTSIMNGYPYLSFGGQAQLLSSINYSFSDASIFVVATQNLPDNAYGRILDHDFQTGFWIGRDASNNNVGGGVMDVNGSYGNFFSAKNDTAFIYSMLRHSDTTFSFMNHSAHSPPYRITSNAPTQSNPISLGASIIGSFFGHKNIFEVIIYDRQLNISEQQQIENYLNNKYAPPIQLQDTITTCAFPVIIRAKKDYFLTYNWQDNTSADSIVINTPGKYYVTVSDVFGRNSSDTVYVIKNTNSNFVNLQTDTAACAGSTITLNAGLPYFFYQWSTTAITNTINVSTSGLYKVTMTDCIGNVSKDSIQVNIHSLPIFNLGGDTIICSNTPFKLKPNLLQLQNSTFIWQDSSTDSTLQINTPGLYSLIATDDIGCRFKDSIMIAVDTQLNNVSLGPDLTRCAGNPITLTSGAAPLLNYSWNDGSTNDSLIVNATGQYSVAVTNTNNCVAKDSINITISGFAPTANFSSSIGCVNQTVSFTNLSFPPLGNMIDSTLWNFGDLLSSTNTSTLSNPVHTFTNTGTYTVTLTAITDSGCQQSIIKTITIYPVPTASFVTSIPCQNDTVSFFNQSTGITGYPITSSYWNFGDASPTSITNITSPKHIFTNTATYPVQLIASNSVGCKDTIFKSVIVGAEVSANFTYGPACLNKATNFQSTSITPPLSSPSYSWNFGTINTSTANFANPIKTYTNSGVYYVSLTVDGNNGCVSSITKLVNVYLSPIASFSIPNFCAKDTSTLLNLSNPQSGIISSYNWKLNNVTFSAVQSPTLSLTNAGNYSIKLTTINSFGCKDSIANSLTIFPLPIVDFSTNPTAYYYLNEPVSFIPNITNANSYLWNMSSGTTYTIQSPTQVFGTEGQHTISLNLKDQQGCKGSKTKNITVSKRHLDLAILNVTTTKDNDGFMTVSTDLANYGSVPIHSFDMHYQISDAGNIKETWNGTISANSFYQYTFNARSSSVKNSINNITCVEIEKVNTITDDIAANNSLCNSLNVDGIYVSNPLPNPTDGDIVLPITLNRDLDYTIAIYNSLGQLQMDEITKKGSEGLNFIPISTSSYARGAYIIKVMVDGEIIIKKIIKIDK
jgi:PKD repeat protein